MKGSEAFSLEVFLFVSKLGNIRWVTTSSLILIANVL
jgi:hypothetical protein